MACRVRLTGRRWVCRLGDTPTGGEADCPLWTTSRPRAERRYVTTTQRENSDVGPNPPDATTTVAVATTTVPLAVEIGGVATLGTLTVPDLPAASVVTTAKPR